MNRIKTGISGLDSLFNDGVPKGCNILLFGRAGSGKTIMSLEFIYRGASQFNEPGVFVSFEQTEKDLIEQTEKFGWNLPKLIKAKKIKIITPDLAEIDRDLANKIIAAVKEIKAERLVIDNLTLLTAGPILNAETNKFNLVYDDKVRIASSPQQLIYHFINILNSVPTTNMYLTVPGKDIYETIDGISEYICDGLINIRMRSLGKSSLRTIEIMKMRKTKIEGGIHTFKITDKGIKVEL